MLNMRIIYDVFILCYYFSFLNLSKGEIINNPIATNITSNPIDYIIILQPDIIEYKKKLFLNFL